MEHFVGSNAELDLCPSRISEEYYVTNRDDLYDRGQAVAFSGAVIRALFGFDEDLCRACTVFSALPSPDLAGGFRFLWEAAFSLGRESGLVRGRKDEVAFTAVFNRQTGRLLLEKAQQLVVRQTVRDGVARVVFRSCMDLTDLPNWEGWVPFDFLTALYLVSLKVTHPTVHTVLANIYFGVGIPLKNLDFPVKVESTEDQRYIYGMINSR